MQLQSDHCFRINGDATFYRSVARIFILTLIIEFTGALVCENLSPAADPITNADQIVNIVENVRRAQDAFSKNASIENRIDVATWLLLFAELSIESGQPLFSLSLDAFDEGQKHLAQVHEAIQKDPKLKQRLFADPKHAMRLDAAHVRQQAVGKRRELARTQELERLHQLRELVQSFRIA